MYRFGVCLEIEIDVEGPGGHDPDLVRRAIEAARKAPESAFAVNCINLPTRWSTLPEGNDGQ
jgi:hypothetical protein